MGLAKFIEKIPKDKKGHLLLGLIVNPLIFIFFILLFNSTFLGFVVSLGFHAFIEIYQKITNTGKFEVLDFLAGSFSAIFIYIITLIQ